MVTQSSMDLAPQLVALLPKDEHCSSSSAKMPAFSGKWYTPLLCTIEDVGGIMAQSLVDFFAQENTRVLIDTLKNVGVNMQSIERDEKVSTALEGLTFVITGTLPTMGRKEAGELIEANGGKVTGSVSKKTDYLLAGEEAGSKLDKAQALGIKIISEEELKNMLS